MATSTGAPYNLPYPQSGDVADVPSDMGNLAGKTRDALNLKLDRTTADSTYQPKIKVQKTGTALPATGNNGDLVVFVP